MCLYPVPAAAAPLSAVPGGPAGLLRFPAGLAEKGRPAEEPGQPLGTAVPQSEPGKDGENPISQQ